MDQSSKQKPTLAPWSNYTINWVSRIWQMTGVFYCDHYLHQYPVYDVQRFGQAQFMLLNGTTGRLPKARPSKRMRLGVDKTQGIGTETTLSLIFLLFWPKLE
jgi:hypothetical protein